ncbi:MAG: antirestriction protein ArdA [Bacteroidales bacterium]|jgi:hypothetical protein
MITLLLTRGNDEGAYMYLPASPAEIGKVFAELDNISGGSTSPIKIIETLSNVYNLHGYIKSTDVEVPSALDKLGELAQELQTMSRDDCLKFEGVLAANSVNGVDDVLRLANALDDYTVLPDACTGTALGKYLVVHDVGNFPESVRPYLDYQIIGAEFYADHGGAYCRGGYAVRKDELPEQFLCTESEQQKNTVMLRLRAAHAGQRTPTDATLLLPASDEALYKAKQKLGIDEFAEAEITVVDYVFPYLATMIPQDSITVEDANELAQAIKQMNQTDGELLKYLAALEVERPGTFTAALNIAIDLDDYEAVPVDKEEYGRMVLERLGADEDILNEIDGFMDYESFGETWMREDGVVRTEFGQIRRLSEPFCDPALGGIEMY